MLLMGKGIAKMALTYIIVCGLLNYLLDGLDYLLDVIMVVVLL